MLSIILLLKALLLVVLAIVIRGTLPRYRVDQLISLNWKYLLFLNLLYIVVLITTTLLFI